MPWRVASLQPSITVTMQRLGVLDRVVACTRYCADVVPEVRESNTRIVQDSWQANADEILAAEPDLVIASVPYRAESVAEILKAGVRFVGFAPKTLSDIYGDIAVIAGLMNVCDCGDSLIRSMQKEIVEIREQTSALPKVRVFAEEWGKPIIHSQRWVAELVEAAGGEYLGTPGAKTESETIRSSDPDVVLMAWCGAGDRVPLEKIVRERDWLEMKAVREGRVYCIADELLNTPGPTLMDGLRAILWALHPEVCTQPSGIRRISNVG